MGGWEAGSQCAAVAGVQLPVSERKREFCACGSFLPSLLAVVRHTVAIVTTVRRHQTCEIKGSQEGDFG